MAAKNIHRFEFRMGRLGLSLFILGMSGLLFAVFLFGVDVGKNIDTYPGRIASYIPDRIRDRAGWATGGTKPLPSPKEEKKPESAGADRDLDLTFYDTLAKKQGDAGRLIVEPPREKRIEAEKAGEVPPQAAKPKAPAVPAPDAKPKKPDALPQAPVALNQQKAAPVTPVPAPAASQKKETAPVHEKFLIQLVAYQQKSKADELAGKLKSLGYAPKVEVTNLPEKGKWFRVIMNGFQSREDAQKTADKISRSVKGLNCVVRPSESSAHP